MLENHELGGGTSSPEPSSLPDRLPSDGHSAAAVQPIAAHRALAAPATVDRAAHTVEVVWSTGARARNFVPSLGLITEELDMQPAAVRMEGLCSGHAPVLNTHRRGDARDVLGRCVGSAFHTAWLDIRPGFQALQAGDLSVAGRQLTLEVANPPEQFQQKGAKIRRR